MSNARAPEAAKTESKDAAKLKSAQPTKTVAVSSDAELDVVTGGLNPQPLPPIVHDRR